MRNWFKKFLLAHPALFILYYFGDKITALEPFHLRLIENAVSEERSLTLYPAGHGKTTLISTLLTIWAICNDPTIRIAIIARNEMDAKGIMRSIQAELLGNEKLIRDFGKFKADDDRAWSIERIDIAQRPKITKEGSIQIYGSGGNVLGKRFDWVICDDVVTEKNSATPDQRQKIREWFNLGVETMPEHPWSRLTVIGTLFDPEDLYADIIELVYPGSEEPIYSVQREDAIVDEDAETTLWPARWTWERLMAQKAKMGTIDFNKRYRNIAVDESRIIFKEAYVRGGAIGKERYPGCLDRNFSIGDFEEHWRCAAGFDPAIGVSKIAKFCAHIVLGAGSCKDHERCYWVIDLYRDQLTMPQQVEVILQRHEQYDLWATIIETNGYQAGLEQVVQQKMQERGQAFNVRPHLTNRVNKFDPEVGVSAMSATVEKGMLHIPWADAHSRKVMELLVDEMVQYPGGRSGSTTDTVMSLWFAWKALQEAAPRFTSFNRLETGTKPSVFTPRRLGRAVTNPAYAKD